MTYREAEKERNKDIIIRTLCDELDRKDRYIATIERELAYYTEKVSEEGPRNARTLT